MTMQELVQLEKERVALVSDSKEQIHYIEIGLMFYNSIYPEKVNNDFPPYVSKVVALVIFRMLEHIGRDYAYIYPAYDYDNLVLSPQEIAGV